MSAPPDPDDALQRWYTVAQRELAALDEYRQARALELELVSAARAAMIAQWDGGPHSSREEDIRLVRAQVAAHLARENLHFAQQSVIGANDRYWSAVAAQPLPEEGGA